MQKSFTTPAAVELYVELGSGLIAVDATETTETTVEVTGPRAEEFLVEQHGDRVTVTAPKTRLGFFGGNDAHDVRVAVPLGSALATRTGSADTEATGSYGRVRIVSGSGDVHVQRSQGAATVASGSGDVRVDVAESDLRIKSGSGTVRVGEAGGTVGVSTGSGDVVIDHSLARAVVKTGSGDLSVGTADDDVSLTTASGDLTVEHARRGAITAKNVSGDVHVGIPDGTPVWTDVTSTSGRVASNLRSVGKPREGQDYVELRASTVSGDIVLEQV